jgi:hypothetical protein
VKLNDLKTARQVFKEESWQVKFLYYLGWPKNQVEILWLKYKPKGKWVPIEDAQSPDEGDQTTR